MMERILEIYLMAVWMLVPSFFWIRGFWRSDRNDRIAGVVLNGVLILTIGIMADPCSALNAGGLWFFALGLITLVLAAFRKVMPREKLIHMCLIMVLAGVLMMMVL